MEYNLYDINVREVTITANSEQVELQPDGTYKVTINTSQITHPIKANYNFTNGITARLLDELLNVMVNHFRAGLEVGAYMSTTHRTLQGSLVNWCLGILCKLAETQYTDARNEKAIRLCRLVKKVVDENGTQGFI